MDIIQIIACLALLFNAVISASIKNDTKLEPRIVGGNAAQSPGQFPYQVSIQLTKFGHFCGGSIIDERHVLTAAHCVIEQKRKDLIIWAGGNVLSRSGNSHKVQHIFIHENYTNCAANNNDIAVIRVEKQFNISALIRPIQINNGTIFDNTECTVSGWGRLNEGGPSTNYLQYANIVTLNHLTCIEQYYGTADVTRNMLCAGGGKKDACQGDSGGPLVCNNKLVGIVSFGVGCARPNFPGVYTKVSAYTKWIQKQIERSYAHPSLPQINIIAMIISMTVYKLIYC